MRNDFDHNLQEYGDECLPIYTEQLIEWVKIPSISQGTAHRLDTWRILESVSRQVALYGFEPLIIETPGNPVLIATLKSDSQCPWLTIYNHMDVQPAKEPQWKTDPFVPVIQDDKIYGRGTTDDKGPALTIIHAIHFLHSYGYPLPNIQLVYETEEEIGSPHFGHFLDQHQDVLHAPDSILVSDTIFEGENPAITYQLKGLLEAEVALETGSKEVHSGVFGGVVRNPVNLLIQALSQCVDGQGHVLVPGFYDGVTEPTEEELDELKKVADQLNLEQLKADSGQASFYTCDPLDILLRLWKRPTFEVHGFEGAQYEPSVIKTSLPYHVKAKLTMRLVPGQDPQHLIHTLEAFLQSMDKDIRVIPKASVKASVTDITHPVMVKAKAACLAGFGKEPLFVGSGGTIGAIPEFQRVYPHAPIVLLAQSLMSDGYHAPNEHFRLSQVKAGIKTMAYYMTHLAER